MTWNRLLTFILVCVSQHCFAQYKDAGLWAGFNLSGELNKKLELSAAPEVRLDENCTRVTSAFIDLGAQYKLNKFFFLTATYRGGTKRSNEFYDPRQRMQLGIGLKKKWEDIAITYSTKWQLAVQSFAAESDADFVNTLRNKMKVVYSGLKKTDLSTSFELFHTTSRFSPIVLQNWRWVGEVERSINKRNSVSLGYLIQKSLLDSPQEMDFVLLISYQLKLSLKKEEVKKEEPTK